MIELNLTYEESKKIFELGYDFSKICDFAWVTMDANETPVLGCQNLEIQYLLFAQKIYDFQTALTKKQPIEIIPIVPKAALEACLPDFDNGSYFSKLHISQDKIVKRNHKDQWVLPYVSSTAFEVFIWCHENYPKELKKKFEEVMK